MICSQCNHKNMSRILYGYPNRFDFSVDDVYGGEELNESSASHLCRSCGTQARQYDELRFFPFPEACHFCSEPMCDVDKFTFQAEYSSWIEQDESPFLLEHGTFTYDPFPTCGECRDSIHTNQKALIEQEMEAAEIKRSAYWYGLFILAAFCALIFYVMSE